MGFPPLSGREEEVASAIVDAAYVLHKTQRQVDLPITFDGIVPWIED